MILNPDGSFYFSGGGDVSTLNYDCTIFEITATGPAGPGAGLADYGSFLDDVSYRVAKDLDGAFIMAGSTGNDTYKEFAISKLTPGLSLDSDFSGDGKVTTTFDGNDFNEAFDMLVQLDNKILAVGYSGNDFALARYIGEDIPELNEFILQTPTDNATNQNYATLAFNWTNAFGASSYEFEIDISEDFDADPELFTPTASARTLTDLMPDQEYFWRVRATDGDEWGEFSEVWSFTTNSLENFNLVSPSNGSSGIALTDVTLDWSTAVGASDYELMVDTDAGFTDAPSTYSTSGTDYDLSGFDPETTYYWRVRASNDGDIFGDWTSNWSFTTTSDAGISNLALSNLSLELYPNPTNGNFNLKVDNQLIGANYSILDLSGKAVATGVLSQELNDINFDKDAGYYVLRIENHPNLSIGFCKK
jgi:archaellin